MRRFLFFIFVCAILQIALSSCPDGFELVSNGECRGYYGQMDLPGASGLNTAITKCNGLHAQTVIIHSQEQQEYWRARYNPQAFLLLGLMCNTVTSKWEWSDGSTVDYKPGGNYNTDLDKNCTTGCTWYILSSDGYWSRYCSSSPYPFDIYCTAQLSPLPVPSADGCDVFEEDSENGVCYQVGKTATNWQDAQNICRNLGADLASIHNAQENSFVRRLAVSNGAVNGLFLGATVSGKENQFGWIDGTEWDYNNFYPGFPVNGLGDCLAMDTQGTTGQWMNTNCNSNYSVACVRQKSESLPPACSSGPWKEGEKITSPGFPFEASIPCDFFLIVDEGKNVKISLEANSCCDRLVINDNLILTGEIFNQNYTTNGSNLMRVSWQPNGAVNVRGLMMQFWGV